jgi:hypothetical protein
VRTVIVRDAMRIPLGKQGENNAVRVVWAGIVEQYEKLYGDGHFELVVAQGGVFYPAVTAVDGADLVWIVRAADTVTAGFGSLELIYYVGDVIAKSQTWGTAVVTSASAAGTTEPPEDPARAWFDEIKRQIGDLGKLTTTAKENLVAAINEAARTGSGSGSVKMRVDGGYIQYSADGAAWENLIAVATLEGSPGKDGAPGKDGTTPHIGDNGNWYIGDTDTGVKAAGTDYVLTAADKAEIVALVLAEIPPTPSYGGEYEVVSKVSTEQTLPTEGKLMGRDVLVHKIPQLEVSNGSGGKTLIIGEE